MAVALIIIKFPCVDTFFLPIIASNILITVPVVLFIVPPLKNVLAPPV